MGVSDLFHILPLIYGVFSFSNCEVQKLYETKAPLNGDLFDYIKIVVEDRLSAIQKRFYAFIKSLVCGGLKRIVVSTVGNANLN